MKKQSKTIFTVAAIVAVGSLVAFSTSCKKSNNNQTSTTTSSTSTPAFGTMTDGEGNTYKTVIIGTQTWTAQNLRSTKYNDGTVITYCAQLNNAWDAYSYSASSSYGTGAYGCYANDTSNIRKYGCLYNWEAVKTGKLAPAGWHVADTADFQTLYNYCKGKYGANNVLTNVIDNSWNSSLNGTGFSALPAGYRNSGSIGDEYMGSQAYFWTKDKYPSSSTTDYAYPIEMQPNGSYNFASNNNYYLGSAGCSVRLVKDNTSGGGSTINIAGTYSVSESCNSGQSTLTSTVTCTSSNCGSISIKNFGGFGTNVNIVGTVSGSAITIPTQTISGIPLSGSGTINNSNSIVITYTYTYTQGSTTDSCTDTYSK